MYGVEGYSLRRLVRRLCLAELKGFDIPSDIWLCLHCARCREGCTGGLDLPELIIELRSLAVKRGAYPAPVGYVKESVVKVGNPLGLAVKPSKWAEGLGLPRRGSRLFFAGFYAIADYAEYMVRSMLKVGVGRSISLKRLADKVGAFKVAGPLISRAAPTVARRALRSTAQALMKLGEPLPYLGDEEPWPGLELYTYGFLEEFGAHAKRVYAKLKELGVEEIVTPDPLTAVAFRQLYPKFVDGFSLEVRDCSEFLAELLDKRPVELKLEGVVATYHDPCMLARYLKVIDQPRQVLSSIKGLRLEEPLNRGVKTICCGAGGLEAIRPDLSVTVASKSVKNLLTASPSLIVSNCPACDFMLRMGVEEARVKVEVAYVGEVVWRALAS